MLVLSPTRMIAPLPCGAYGCIAEHSMAMMRSVLRSSFGFVDRGDRADEAFLLGPREQHRDRRRGGFARSWSSIASAAAAPARSSQTRL